MPKVAAIQMVSSPNVDENIEHAKSLIESAAAQGAELILLPEYWPIMGNSEQDKSLIAEPLHHGKLQKFLAEQAMLNKVWIIGGTIPIQSPIPNKTYNTVTIYNHLGEQVDHYHKMHLFQFEHENESYNESLSIAAGDRAVKVNSPFGDIGMSVCYDLRFPELYRQLNNCNLIVVPAAFTYTTGKAHWEILLRARAIENQCYILASGQGGIHKNGRHTWGHSMLINPWGEIVAEHKAGEGIAIGDMDLTSIASIRSKLPALQHRML